MDFTPILVFLGSLAPWINIVFAVLGALVLLGTFIDSVIDDKVDGGFMKKILAIPVLGAFLEALIRFSPFNTRDK